MLTPRFSNNEKTYVTREIDCLNVRKGVVELSPPLSKLGFPRTILKMEGISMLVYMFQRNHCMIMIDLKDAYIYLII